MLSFLFRLLDLLRPRRARPVPLAIPVRVRQRPLPPFN
jgi:hypothetical protein